MHRSCSINTGMVYAQVVEYQCRHGVCTGRVVSIQAWCMHKSGSIDAGMVYAQVIYAQPQVM